MTLIPDVPVVVIVVHLVALAALLAHALLTNWQRLTLLRQNGIDLKDLL